MRHADQRLKFLLEAMKETPRGVRVRWLGWGMGFEVVPEKSITPTEEKAVHPSTVMIYR